ncbi:MAG: c-type cytochrome [Elusimicrobia bacterium]|nr:c-type cytochrome [Elusimicrobiota bacterium]
MTHITPRAAQGRASWAAAAVFFALFISAAAARAGEAKAPSPFQKSAALFLQACSKCHTIGGGRRVGPDLRGVADRHDKDWIVGFVQNPESYLDSDPAAKKLLAENNGVRMENAHVTREQAEGLLEFITAAASAPSGEARESRLPEEPLTAKLRMPDEGVEGRSLPALALFAVLLLAALALARFGRRRDASLLFVLAAAAAYWGFGGWRHHRLAGDQQGYEPAQPIAFSHELHAGKLTIACLYCHGGAERSDTAGVPSAGICMNCHGAVRARAGQKDPSPEIARIVAAWETRTSSAPLILSWTRVHHLPDYVHFSHRAHIADNLQCQECHGPVQTMARVRQAAPLSMGWCVSCHRTPPQSAPSHWKRVGGPLDCAACHW